MNDFSFRTRFPTKRQFFHWHQLCPSRKKKSSNFRFSCLSCFLSAFFFSRNEEKVKSFSLRSLPSLSLPSFLSPKSSNRDFSPDPSGEKGKKLFFVANFNVFSFVFPVFLEIPVPSQKDPKQRQRKKEERKEAKCFFSPFKNRAKNGESTAG